MALRLKLAMARQRVATANAQVSSFDLRARATILRRRIEQQRERLRGSLDRIVTRKHREFTATRVRLASIDLRVRVARLRYSLEQQATELRARIDRALVTKRHRLEAAAMQLQERSPFRLLERGYAIAYDASGRVLRSADQVALGDDISVRLARGQLDAAVRRKRDAGQPSGTSEVKEPPRNPRGVKGGRA
jgi:exodeoxyribonuclease VII large subunit